MNIEKIKDNLDKKVFEMNKIFDFFKKCAIFYRLFEISILVIIFVILVFFSFLQIFLRIVWFDSVIKYSVLWLGFLAASLAVSEGKHIKIDLLARVTKGKLKNIILAVTDSFASFVTILLAIASFNYIFKIEISSSDPPPFLNIYRWQLLMILPVGFLIMSIKFFINAVIDILKFKSDKED